MGSTGKASNSRYRAFRALSLTEASDFVENLPDVDSTDIQLNSISKLQSLIDYLGMHGKPTVLTDDDFDSRVAI